MSFLIVIGDLFSMFNLNEVRWNYNEGLDWDLRFCILFKLYVISLYSLYFLPMFLFSLYLSNLLFPFLDFVTQFFTALYFCGPFFYINLVRILYFVNPIHTLQ